MTTKKRADFLLELLSEEIPARMQARARGDLARMFVEQLASAALSHDGIVTYSTPRRLVLTARGLPLATEAVAEEIKGPRISAPPKALEGFLRKTGLSQTQLEDRDGTWFATIDRPGRSTAEVLAEAVAAIVGDFPWPKAMRWGEASSSMATLRWVRPLHSIVALLGDDIVPVTIQGVACGAATLGHRFHHPGPITIGGAHDYVEKLRACHVIVDQEEREAIVRTGAIEAAENAGFNLVEDEGLVVENAGLTEWPVPLLGSFDPDFLDVPKEVIALTARTNQKYFVMRDGQGQLAPHFICTANIDANDGGAAIIVGNERVLAARLSDARFFWQQDLQIPLKEQAKKLGEIIFHEKLGTVADKVERVAKLARWLVEQHIVTPAKAGAQLSQELDSRLPGNDEGVAELADLAERAARLAKADLVTGMVGEFPELQGVIGGYLARAQGEPDVIAAAIRDHYKPVGQGDEVPTAPATVAVGLADKLDSLFSFFAIDEKPTGSKDPFALRRSALGALSIQTDNKLRFDIEAAYRNWSRVAGRDWPGAANGLEQVRYFLADRLKVQQREAGVRHDLIDAVYGLGKEDDLVRLLARVTALQAFVETGEGANLLAAYKRAANILKKENWTGRKGVMSVPGSQGISQTGEEDPLALVEEPAIAQAVAEMAEARRSHETWLPGEAALRDAVDAAATRASAGIAQEDFTAAMAALASLRAPIDAFFDKVTVNDPDPALRERRLNLLARFRDAVGEVSDFSKIEG
ncbi:MAG TPA: glycine--tRNA ligase subunit beta [Sphingomicrobium sp.]|nr:glycine--tRNA ligase subunit beta [Sphingomicrobium sp.]